MPGKCSFLQAAFTAILLVIPVGVSGQDSKDWYESRFLDKDTVLDLGVELLYDYLEKVASRFPDNPYLGKDAIKNIRIQYCTAPAGVFFRIMEDFEWRGRHQQMQPMPNQNGIILWVAAAPRSS
jgi:hypothetical protein